MKHDPNLSAERIHEPRLGQHLTDAELAQELLDRAQRRPVSGELLTEEEVAADIASRLDGRRGEQGRAAQDLGVSQATLSQLLHGAPISAEMARKLGYRRVVRFERIG